MTTEIGGRTSARGCCGMRQTLSLSIGNWDSVAKEQREGQKIEIYLREDFRYQEDYG